MARRWCAWTTSSACSGAATAGCAPLDGVTLPVEPAGFTHIFNQFVIRLPNRDAVRERLAQAGIGTEVYYPVPFHKQECFAPLGHPADAFPNADRAAASSLALPIYAELTADQQGAGVDALASALAA